MSEIKNETISIELHEKIIDDLKVQHRYMYDSMKDQNWRIIKWLLCIIAALIIIFAGYVFYQTQFETYYYAQEATTENASAFAFMNTGEGDVNYNGNDSQASDQNSGEENQLEKPDENMP